MTAPGYVLFRLGERQFATPLEEIREIVRLTGLEQLPGAKAPLAGVIVVRGVPLPVLDVRDRARVDGEASNGDVLVTTVAGDLAGIAVDTVLAVLAPDDLPEGDPPARTLPAYVVGVRRHAGAPVLLVDLHRLLEAAGGSDVAFEDRGLGEPREALAH